MDENLVEGTFSVKHRSSRAKETHRRLIRKKLFLEARGNCLYCGIKMFLPCKDKDGKVRTLPDTATLDHIVPVSKGGTNVQTNLLICCADCNSRKGNSSLFIIMRSKSQVSERTKYLDDENKLRTRASCWFNLESE